VLACAQAAELGEPVVRSFIGQPLVADIELSALADGATPVQVKLANPDIYRGAGIGMHPVLSSLNMTVMRRDGRQFLHITSIKPLDAEYVHIFFELADGGRRNVRGTTLWLTPDPNPVPPPAAAPAPLPAPAPSDHALEAAIARAAMPAPAPLRAAPGGRAACPQPFSAEQIRTCAELDYKNAALTAQIVELEDKVRLLQLAVDGKPEHPAPAAPKKAAPAPPAPKPVPAPARKTPWLLTALGVAALLALAGAGFVILRKKRAAKAKAKPAAAPDEPPRPSFIASVKNRLMPGKKEAPPVAAAAVEPSAG
jgi:pilus assembly protein FimV